MRLLGNRQYRGKECYACYLTYDHKEFLDLRLAKKHADRLEMKIVFYVITDKDGNRISTKVVY